MHKIAIAEYISILDEVAERTIAKFDSETAYMDANWLATELAKIDVPVYHFFADDTTSRIMGVSRAYRMEYKKTKLS